MTQEEKVHQKLRNLEEIFDIRKLIDFKLDDKYIKRYYWLNKIAYTIFHSKEGFVHFAICPDGRYSKEGLLYQPKRVAEYIKDKESSNVLELACGRGANLEYLARNFGNTNFYGIDLSPAQLNYARKKARKLKNVLSIEQGNFHNLERYKDNQFDTIFIFEALCYSTQKQKVFNEVGRILKPKGVFIVADAYWRQDKLDKNSDEYIVKRLSELGMALNEYESYDRVVVYSKKDGFKIIKETDVTKYLLANCDKFEKLFERFLNKRWKAKILKTILPNKFLYNGFFGYFAGDGVRAGWAKYLITVFEKQ